MHRVHKKYVLGVLLAVVGAVLVLAYRAHAQLTNVAQQQAYVACQIVFGYLDWTHTSLLNYLEPSTTTAAVADSVEFVVPANSVGNQFQFSSSFPAAQDGVAFFVQDITYPAPANGVFVGMDSQSPGSSIRIPLNPGGFLAGRITGQMCDLVFQNTNPSTQIILRIGIMSQ
jgi:hypothetical protein